MSKTYNLMFDTNDHRLYVALSGIYKNDVVVAENITDSCLDDIQDWSDEDIIDYAGENSLGFTWEDEEGEHVSSGDEDIEALVVRLTWLREHARANNNG